MIEELKHLYEIGFSIIWLKPRSKQPVEMSWTKKDRHSFAALREMHVEGMNVGVRLGSNSKLENGAYLSVIDCDVKSEDPVHLLEMEKSLDGLGFDWTLAPTVLSGRGNGSRHLYVSTREPLAPFTLAKSGHVVKVPMPSVERLSNKEKELLTEAEIAQGLRLRPAWEISVMGSGQQVVLPPSIHPDSGRPYEWANEIRTVRDIEIVELAKPVLEGPGLDRSKIKSPTNIVFPVVDLLSSKLSSKYFNLIVRAEGLEHYGHDKSRAVMACVFAMVNIGFSDDEIMSVLTDVENELAVVAFEHAKTRDRMKAARWIYKYNIVKARREVSAEKAFDGVAIVEDVLSEDDAMAQDLEVLGDWEARLDRNAHMTPRPTFKNTALILAHVAGEVLFKYDKLYQSERYAAVPPWHESLDHRGAWVGREISDVDLSAIQNYLGSHFKIEPSIDFISRAVSLIARKNSFHPVREYLDGLTWDGVPRIDTWLRVYAGVQLDNLYVKEVSAKFLCAMVARAMNPGVKFDTTLILEGEQGIYKSTACAVLAGSWFSNRIGDIGSKDVVEAMRGNWVIELSELAGMRKHDVKVLKDFLSTQVDEVRKAYARRSEKYPRQCVFIGTTNESEYFQDETGNRRFWPVKVTKIKIDKLREDRDQLFAEAYERWAEGEDLHLSLEADAEAKEEQGQRVESDEWEDQIEELLKTDEFLPGKFTVAKLYERHAGGTDINNMKLDKYKAGRIRKILKRLGYESTPSYMGKNEKTKRLWTKKEKGEN